MTDAGVPVVVSRTGPQAARALLQWQERLHVEMLRRVRLREVWRGRIRMVDHPRLPRIVSVTFFDR